MTLHFIYTHARITICSHIFCTIILLSQCLLAYNLFIYYDGECFEQITIGMWYGLLIPLLKAGFTTARVVSCRSFFYLYTKMQYQ